jgi:hypothetical protein
MSNRIIKAYSFIIIIIVKFTHTVAPVVCGDEREMLKVTKKVFLFMFVREKIIYK